MKRDRVLVRDFRRGSRALVYVVNVKKGLQKKLIVPLIASELAPAESSGPGLERESSASRLS